MQGALDVRYLGARYEKGKQWVGDYMQKKQRFLSIPKSNAHADILSWQQGVTGDKLLGPFLVMDCARLFLVSVPALFNDKVHYHDFGLLALSRRRCMASLLSEHFFVKTQGESNYFLILLPITVK